MWIVCITSVRHVLTVNGYGGRQTKENEKSWCFKGWETLVNKSSMLVVEDEMDFGKIIDEMRFLDENDDAYLSKLRENWFVRVNEKEYWKCLFIDFFDNIFSQDVKKAKRCPRYGFVKNLLKEEERVSYLKKNYLWDKMWGLFDRLRNKK